MTSQHLTFYIHTVDAKRHCAEADDALVSLLDCDVQIFVNAVNAVETMSLLTITMTTLHLRIVKMKSRHRKWMDEVFILFICTFECLFYLSI